MDLKLFREAIGLPQRYLAHWLGTSRELIAQNEIGQREIPQKARSTFYQLNNILQQLPEEEPVLPKPFTDQKYVGRMQTKILTLKYQLQVDEYKILVLKKKMAVQKKALLFCQALQENSLFKDQMAVKILDLFQFQTLFNWEKAGPRELKKLEFYLNQKKEECAFLEEYVKVFE